MFELALCIAAQAVLVWRINLYNASERYFIYLHDAINFMKRNDRRSDCPVNFAVEAVGDSWSLLVIRDMVFNDKRSYSELLNSLERISTNILANRLKSLAENGLIEKVGSGRSGKYSLTAKGLGLIPLLLEMVVWAGKHDPETAAPKAYLDRLERERPLVERELRSKLIEAHEIAI